MKRAEINIFGDKSIAYVKKYGETYAIIRECDEQVLMKSDSLAEFIGYPVYTMYTGERQATGEYILQVDMGEQGIKKIYTWKSYERMLEELKNTDEEYSHIEADRILCDLLEHLGYTDVVEAYNSITKYYS